MIDFIFKVIKYIGAITLYILGSRISHKIIEDIEFRVDGLEYILYFGVGVILYYPCKYIIDNE